MAATTYRRGTTVTRNGTTFQRRGGTVKYHPGRDENPLLEALASAGGWLGGKLWDGLESVTSLRGRKAQREHDRHLAALMRERAELMRLQRETDNVGERLELIKRVHQIDKEWRATAVAGPRVLAEPELEECIACGDKFDPEDGQPCTHGLTLCANSHCRAQNCGECRSDLMEDDGE